MVHELYRGEGSRAGRGRIAANHYFCHTLQTAPAASKMADTNDNFPPALQDCVIGNITIGNQIGRGANGRILEAKWEGIIVAVKEIHSIFMNEVGDLEFQSFKRSFLRECEQSSRLRHPNIVRFFGIYHPPGARVPSLVMERLHCSLTSLLENNSVVPGHRNKSIHY